ncbi:MFS transporter [Prosthecobacter vanneervenii]|uniref:Acyl-[acyl-carrier-protein]-phospholipid O-acyltransferase/long-chain-fatty-acid--[acyl-carrier-protein] ligase n=1 Tax=Prosthecobacter vanneervenii TaxID=48466 RepID=A0A7W8DL29_9BACT|nr:MFS transporter [Prosthecobacter vanneervenii]MBB5033441.1 acyl-[acyl-carrier-protein]-phospholipid O-acyltransferase/long-chain-fatty-acid--[acyl-carrier-protein] ligase [Prosthecobacter vanneervenii]
MPDSADLDHAPHLPRRNWASIVLVLFVQAMNSFSDNFVKMLLIALSIIIAKDSWVGRHMELWLGAIFSLPYMIFAPLAGYWSDRFSKRNVIIWMQVMQIICFVWLSLALWMQRVPGSLEISLVGFFVLAVQAAVLSPAKMGIMKELAGSRRLGQVSGWLQVTMLAGILGGMWAGGVWYGTEYEKTHDAWMSALWPLIVISIFGILELIASLCIQPTPSHTEVHWRKGMALEHFESLKIVFRRRSIRLAALGVTYFWFISNALSFILVTLTKELHPDTGHGDGPMELAKVAGILGIGVISGSFFASHISRNRIELGLIPLGGFGLVAGLLWSGLAPLGSSWMYAGIIFTGAAGGCFMVPLYAFAQDKAEKQEKARIHAGMNLMDCLGTLVAVAIVALMKWLDLHSSTQFLILAIPTFAAAVYIMRLLPQDLVRFLMLAAVRFTYKVRPVHVERIPATGGVLLLPNHVSYVDALIVGSASRRPVRFVMWDALYNLWWLKWLMRLVGTVPISATRAKDAVRAVAAALQEGEVVCLFPEGQITRHGMINELRRGFELMARQADAQVVPVYLDGLYGSIFSFQGGKFFTKRPKHIRYPVSVHFGQPLAPRAATAEAVRQSMLQLSSSAFLQRKSWLHAEADLPAFANALRLAEVEWHQAGDVFLSLEPEGSIIHRTVKALTQVMPGTKFIDHPTDAHATHIVAFCTRTTLSQLTGHERLVFCLDSSPTNLPPPLTPTPPPSPGSPSPSPSLGFEASAKEALRGYIDPLTSLLLSTETPNPPMPAGDKDEQLGRKPSTLGRLLPGLAIHPAPEGLHITGLLPKDDRTIILSGMKVDEHGFLVATV